MYVAVIYSKGPAWADTEAPKDKIHAHIAHQRKHFEAGKLVMGGPFIEEPGGMAIFDVAFRDEAAAIVRGDPAVTSGIYAAALHPWRVASSKYSQ